MPYNKNGCGCDFSNVAQITVIDKDCRGNRLGGGEYELCKCNKPIDRKRANSCGECKFCGLLPGEYTVIEVDPPCGYYPCNDRCVCIVRKNCCCSFENCKMGSYLKVFDDNGMISSFDQMESEKDCDCDYRR